VTILTREQSKDIWCMFITASPASTLYGCIPILSQCSCWIWKAFLKILKGYLVGKDTYRHSLNHGARVWWNNFKLVMNFKKCET